MNRISVLNPWAWLPSLSENWDEDEFAYSQSVPPMDIEDEGEKIKVRIQIPGYNKDMVKISVDRNKLTVSGQMEKKESKEDKSKFYKREIQIQSSFTRSCVLPVEVDSENAKAEFKEGELYIYLPKSEKAQVKSIPIA